jgi:nitrogenase iron protein NifH
MLMHGRLIPTVMDQVRERGDKDLTIDDVVFTGYGGVRCVEAGGPEPGVGCAGRGIIATFQVLERLGALHADVVVYDVLGDVVCGGFAMPMREGYAQEVYLVTSGELMSLYAANNICKAIKRLSGRSRGQCRLGGVICNAKNLPDEKELVATFAEKIGSTLIQFIPRDSVVQRAELNRMTVIEFAPESTQAGAYSLLARKILENKRLDIPEPLDIGDLEAMAYDFITE